MDTVSGSAYRDSELILAFGYDSVSVHIGGAANAQYGKGFKVQSQVANVWFVKMGNFFRGTT
jgi:hypothetical protein